MNNDLQKNSSERNILPSNSLNSKIQSNSKNSKQWKSKSRQSINFVKHKFSVNNQKISYINTQNSLSLNYQQILSTRIRQNFKQFISLALIPHLCATLFLFLMIGIRNNIVKEVCFMDNDKCRDCSYKNKLFYIFPVITIEYLIPILYGYYFCFFTNSFKRFSLISAISMILYYAFLYLMYFFWDFKLAEIFPEKTLDNFVYGGLSFISSFMILPYLKFVYKIPWKKFILKNKYNIMMIVMACSTFTILINILTVFQKGLQNKSKVYQNVYQVFLLLFCLIYETSLIYIFTRYHKNIQKEWKNNNSPLMFIAKNCLMFSYAIRLANISALSESEFGFYLQIVTFTQFILEMLSGKSLVESLIRKIKHIYKIKKKVKDENIIFPQNTIFSLYDSTTSKQIKDSHIECLRILSYQKMEFMMVYIPRILSLILYNKWSISQPFFKLVDGCSFNVNKKVKINANSLMILMGVDFSVTIIFLRMMVKNKKLLFYVKFEAENMCFFYKVLVYIGFQLCFEYWFHYYMNMIYA